MRAAILAFFVLLAPACNSLVGVQDLEVAEGRRPAASTPQSKAADEREPAVENGEANDASTTPVVVADADAPPAPPPPPVCAFTGGYDLSGSWHGQFAVDAGFPGLKFQGSGIGALNQTCENVTGTLTVSNSCIKDGTLAVTLDGHNYTGTIRVGDDVEVTISGQVSADGNRVSGKFRVQKSTLEGCAAGQVGDLVVQRRP